MTSGRPRPRSRSCLGSFGLHLSEFMTTYLMILVPLALIPVLYLIEPPHEETGAPKDSMKCLYLLLVMAWFWMTQALPLPITAMIPLAYLPLAGVQGTKEVAASYLNATTLMFVGGLIMAIGVEESNLHKRIALGALRLVGSRDFAMMAAFMGKTVNHRVILN